ncbi:MAG TPA: hypothetical protein PLY68_05660 [Myxococcota bacterium]|nr:hypothetical protein [Myxococcota bacterium]HQP95667.1 hypothetical protein [Myxococcota bacterium]
MNSTTIISGRIIRMSRVAVIAAMSLAILATAGREASAAEQVPTVSMALVARTGLSVVTIGGGYDIKCTNCHYMGTAGVAVELLLSPLRELIPSRITGADWIGGRVRLGVDASFDERPREGGAKLKGSDGIAVIYPWVAPGAVWIDAGLLLSLDGRAGNRGPKLGLTFGGGAYFGGVEGLGPGFMKCGLDFEYLAIADSGFGMGVGMEIPFYIQGNQGAYNAFEAFSPNTPAQQFHVPWQIIVSLSWKWDVNKALMPEREADR